MTSELEIKTRDAPSAHAKLIASTLGEPVHNDDSGSVMLGTLVRRHLEAAERARPQRHELETVDFAKLDDDTDWSDI